MVMGRNSSESTAHGMDYTVEPLEDISLADQLHEAVRHIHGTYQEVELPDLGEGEEIRDTIPADPDVKNFSYALVDGEVYFRERRLVSYPPTGGVANGLETQQSKNQLTVPVMLCMLIRFKQTVQYIEARYHALVKQFTSALMWLRFLIKLRQEVSHLWKN